MENLKSILHPKKWTKIVIGINTVIVFMAFIFYCGMRSAECTINNINEAHFVNPDLIDIHRLYEPTIVGMCENILKDSLSQLKPPYSEKRLNGLITHLFRKGICEKFFKVLNADSSGYKILVTPDRDSNSQNSYELITAKSTFYLKPLKIIKDLKPDL